MSFGNSVMKGEKSINWSKTRSGTECFYHELFLFFLGISPKKIISQKKKIFFREIKNYSMNCSYFLRHIPLYLYHIDEVIPQPIRQNHHKLQV